MFNLIKSLFLIFPAIIQLLSLVSNILKAVKLLNNQKITINKENEDKNNATENQNESSRQENKIPNKNSGIDEEKLIELENRSFFVIRCKNDFYSLDESVRKLPPEVFKEKYLDFCKKDQVDSSTTKSKIVESNESRIKQKNILINKIYFIINKYGLAKDFEALPQEIKELNPEDFKNYAEKNF